MALYILAPDPNGQCCECSARLNPCDTCESPPACSCDFPIFSVLAFINGAGFIPDNFLTAAEAEDILNDTVPNCYGSSRGYKTFNVSNPVIVPNSVSSSTPFDISATFPSFLTVSASSYQLARALNTLGFSFQGGDEIPINYSASTTASFTSGGTPTCSNGMLLQIGAVIYKCVESVNQIVWSGTNLTYCDEEESEFISSGSSTSGTLLPEEDYSGNFIVPEDGVYYIVMSCNLIWQGGSVNIGANDTISLTLSIPQENNRIPLPTFTYFYYDSTRTRIDACPKLIIPISSTGAWYASLAAAQSAITNLVSNCIGFFATSSGYNSFSVTSSSGTVTGTFNAPAPTLFGQPTGTFYILIQSTQSGSLSFSCVATAGSVSNPADRTVLVAVEIYDSDLVSIGSNTNSGNYPSISTNLSLSVPYAGSFYIRCSASASGGSGTTPIDIAASFTMTASMSYQVGTVQALYNTGLDCPARLDCS